MIAEEPVTISVTSDTALEGLMAIPAGAAGGVVLCHPHPLRGGNMDSPVVVQAAEACAGHGLATLRFNFRGVGDSTGAWDEGRGEQDDVRAAMDLIRKRLGPAARVGLAGYSFGAAMAARVTTGPSRPDGLALIAPPLAFPGWQPPPGLDGPILIVAGRDDQYCPPDAITALARELPDAVLTIIDGTDHFFFTGLPALATAINTWASKLRRG